MIARLARRLATSYAGAASVYLGAIIALGMAATAWPFLERTAIYPDVIVGDTTWENIDKARDFRALYLFFGATALLSVGLAWLRRHKRCLVYEADRSTLRTTLICATLPAIWWLAFATTRPRPTAGVMPGTLKYAVLGALAAVTAAALSFARPAIIARAWSSVHGTWRVKLAVVVVVLGAFAGLAVVIAIERILPGLSSGVDPRAPLFVMAGATTSFGLLVFVSRKSRLARERHRLQGLLLLGVQLPLPLLFIVVVPPPLLYRGLLLDGGYKIALPIAVGMLAALAWSSLWWRHRSFRTGTTDASAGDSINGIELLLSPLCMAAIALYVAVPGVPAPRLVGESDHLHFGESALPWQQWTEWGKIPYVDFVPIHGLMPLLRGFLNAVFFDNAASGFAPSAMLLAALFALTLFFSVRPLVGTLMASVITAFSLHPLMSDRFFFLAPTFFVLANPGLVSRPLAWLAVWLIVLPLMALYNAAIGAAIAFGTLPVGLAMAYRLARSNGRRLVTLLAGAGVAVGIMFVTPPVRAIAGGFLTFLQENQSVNNVANAVGWEQSFHRVGSAFDFIRQCVWGLSRISWIIVMLIAFQLAWQEFGRPRDQRGRSLLWLAALIIPTLLILAQWAFGRIDPLGGTRTDSLSYVTLFQILPVLLLLARPAVIGSGQRVASIAVAVAVTAGLADWRAGIRAMEGGHAIYPRFVSAEEGLVRGLDLGLPNVGRVIPNRTLRDAIALKAALGPLLRPGETYMNLTLASDFFYYVDLPVPTLYAETIVPASGAMQARMLRQIAHSPPPVVLAAPWSVWSLRHYYLYRYFLLHYPAVRRGGFVFLVAPERVADALPIGSKEEIVLLDSIYRLARLEKLPSSWGRSWRTLAPRFVRVATLGPDRRSAGDGTLRTGEGRSVDDSLSVFSYQVSDLALSGAQADFVKVDLVATSVSQLRVTWAADGRPLGDPIGITPATNSKTLLIPLGATPSWLLTKRIDTLRFEVVGIDPATGTHPILQNVTLLHLQAAR